MSELGEIFEAHKKVSKEKKAYNHKQGIEILKKNGVEYKKLNNYHYRVGDWDYWPSTGKFINTKNHKKKGRGIFNLLKKIGAQDET